MNKTYNVAAFGIPALIASQAVKLLTNLPLRYTRHAMSEALADKYGVLPASAFPRTLRLADGWELVEVEVGFAVDKVVVRRPVDARRSLVLVILADGTVKTLWTNTNDDHHATLDKSRLTANL